MKTLTYRIIFLILAISHSGTTFSESRIKSLENTEPTRILFIGNSYLYYNDSLHNHLRRMAEEKFPDRSNLISYKSSTIGGSRLEHHNIDHLLKATNIGVKTPFELVILQGGSREPLSKKSREQFHKQVKIMISKIKANGGEAALYMTHAYVKPHKDYAVGMIKDIKSLYLKAGNDNQSLVIPVGLAFEKAYQYSPDIKLHKDFDGSHPSLLGTYLAANVVFAALFKTSPIGLTYNYFDTISDKDRDFLQKIATLTVGEFFK